MDIRSLQLYVALAEELHFGRAARICHVSPSAATRSIQRLEADVGATLLDRDSRRVLLTPSGKAFLAYARDAIRRWSDMRVQLDPQQSSPRGKLRLYCSVTAAYSVLASILPKVRTKYSEIEMHLSTGDQADALWRVGEGQDDLAIAAHPGGLPDDIAFLSLQHSPLVCIAPRAGCNVAEQVVPGRSVGWNRIPVIMPESGLVRTRLEQWFREQQLEPEIYAYVRGHEAIVGLVALGFGVAVVPQIVLENSPLYEQIVLHSPGPELEAFDIGLIARRRRLEDPLVRAVWQLASESH